MVIIIRLSEKYKGEKDNKSCLKLSQEIARTVRTRVYSIVHKIKHRRGSYLTEDYLKASIPVR